MFSYSRWQECWFRDSLQSHQQNFFIPCPHAFWFWAALVSIPRQGSRCSLEKFPAQLVWGVGTHTKLCSYPGWAYIRKERESSWRGNVSTLCLIYLNMTSTGVWGHNLLLCLEATPAGIPLARKCQPSFLSVARMSHSASLWIGAHRQMEMNTHIRPAKSTSEIPREGW